MFPTLIEPHSDFSLDCGGSLESLYVRPGLLKQYEENTEYAEFEKGTIKEKDNRDYAYVEFDDKNGHFGDDVNNNLRVIRVKKGQKPVFQLTPYCDGKTFKKWDSTFKVVTGDTTYSAIYE